MVKECNGRGSQHVHMLAYGSVMPTFVSSVVSVPPLKEKYLKALETQVWTAAVPRSGRDCETDEWRFEGARRCIGHAVFVPAVLYRVPPRR